MADKLIIALMTCHNRREKTLASIGRFMSCELPEGYARKVVLTDDGSVDGTADAVKAAFPDVVIEKGDGSLFWNRGMLRAWQRALQLEPDFVLWLNDDTLLYHDALSYLIETDAWIRKMLGKPGISVGSTENAHGELSYGGGVAGTGWSRFKLRRVVPAATPQPAETMNGNCVLVPREVFARIGLLNGAFRHGMGDTDYGFRAFKAGIPIWVMPGFAGRCDNDNYAPGSFNDRTLPLKQRWMKIMSPKGLPPASWWVFCRSHAGFFWPLFWAWPYAKVILTSFFPRQAVKR